MIFKQNFPVILPIKFFQRSLFFVIKQKMKNAFPAISLFLILKLKENICLVLFLGETRLSNTFFYILMFSLEKFFLLFLLHLNENVLTKSVFLY